MAVVYSMNRDRGRKGVEGGGREISFLISLLFMYAVYIRFDMVFPVLFFPSFLCRSRMRTLYTYIFLTSCQYLLFFFFLSSNLQRHTTFLYCTCMSFLKLVGKKKEKKERRLILSYHLKKPTSSCFLHLPSRVPEHK